MEGTFSLSSKGKKLVSLFGSSAAGQQQPGSQQAGRQAGRQTIANIERIRAYPSSEGNWKIDGFIARSHPLQLVLGWRKGTLCFYSRCCRSWIKQQEKAKQKHP